MNRTSDVLVSIATYNEIDNLPRLVLDIFRHVGKVDILVVDDNSPDGTGRWCDEAAAAEPRLRCLHRPSKLGLGTAAVAGIRYAARHGYRYLVNLDADLSHDPRYLPEMIGRLDPPGGEPKDVVVGSRYVAGGGVTGWPVHRRWMSRAVNAYARGLLRLPVRDCSGSYRCYRVSKLEELDFDQFCSHGYSIYEELLWRLRHVGARFDEMPIVFVDRRFGQTKINMGEACRAVVLILGLALRGRRPIAPTGRARAVTGTDTRQAGRSQVSTDTVGREQQPGDAAALVSENADDD